MPHRAWALRIHDILEAVEAIQIYTAGMSFENFQADRRTVDAVIRNFIVIGEAAARVPDEICQRHPEIPWSDMRGLRNFIVHEYFGVSDKLLFDTIRLELQPLLPVLNAILSDKKK